MVGVDGGRGQGGRGRGRLRRRRRDGRRGRRQRRLDAVVATVAAAVAAADGRGGHERRRRERRQRYPAGRDERVLRRQRHGAAVGRAAAGCVAHLGGRGAPLGPLLAVLHPVPPVLDQVVGAVGVEPLGDLGPLGAELPEERRDLLPLLLRDGLAVQARLEVLVIALAALLGVPRAHGLRDLDPVQPGHRLDQVQQLVVLGLRPRTPLQPPHLCL